MDFWRMLTRVYLCMATLWLLGLPSCQAEVRKVAMFQHDNMSDLRGAIPQLIGSCVCSGTTVVSDADGAQVRVPCVEVEKVRGRNVVLRSYDSTMVCRASSSQWIFLDTQGEPHNPLARYNSLAFTPDMDEVDAYHNWTAARALLDEWVATLAPQDLHTEVTDIGESIEGRSIPCVCMVAARTRFTYPPTMLVVGGHHAREWISVEAPLRMIRKFLEGFSVNTRIRSILHNVRLCIIPNLNPDGYVFSWEAGWAGNIPRRMWRKNRRGTGPGGSGGTVFGVDLNRNYGIDWQDDTGSSTRPTDDIYRGSAALSEPETQSLYKFVLSQHGNGNTKNRQRIAGFVSIHSYGNNIMFPFGYNTNAFGPNEALLRSLGNEMKAAIMNVTGNTYEAMKAADDYLCSGDAVDAVYTAIGFAPSFTIETRPGITECCGFNLKPRFIESATSECFTAVALIAEYIAAATQHGVADAAWAHHSFNASYITSVTSSSNFTAADRVLEDWSQYVLQGSYPSTPTATTSCSLLATTRMLSDQMRRCCGSWATRMKAAIKNATGNTYEAMKAADDYLCSGDAVDAVYTAIGFAPSFTIETRPGITECCGFNLKPRFIESATTECFTAVALIAEYIAAATQHGVADAAWAHHSFNASYITSVTSTSNFTAADRVLEDWSQFIIDAPTAHSDGQHGFRTKWLVLRIDGALLLSQGRNTSHSRDDVRLQSIHVIASLLQRPEVGLEMKRAAYLPSWGVFSCVVALTATSVELMIGALERLVEIADNVSGPIGRPQFGLAFP
ncbi:carboxypeptidase B, putative [Bodo saltans]|uniref:Carboxypeptidase B, putative n=1 Tax=Bodo saltans TaxID=75058 RepID=A0A0S4J9W6_BODSA|nr:carboxypeptidase B, putative [Bodo saltans]|eukprot:CUG88214.1 carboxypeptidase B, putative [Bodo saltans]